jgi:exopolysaccharide biosynthesis polyprenyl glycosylphosphotransferase
MSVQAEHTASPRRLGALQVHRLIDLIAIKLLPALVAGAITWEHSGGAGAALLVVVSILAAAQLLERSRFPLALMPAARIALALLAPVVGVGAAVAITSLAGKPIPPGELAPSVMGAWLVIALGAWTKARVEEGVRVRVAVLGSAERDAPALARDLQAELAGAGIRAFEVAGWLTPQGSRPHGAGTDWLGSLDDPRATIVGHRLDLIVCGPGAHRPELEATGGIWAQVISACDGIPIRMMGVNQFYEDLLGHVPMGTIDSAWYQYLVHPRYRATSRVSKRAFDLVLGTLLSIVALPILLVSAIAIKLDGGGPVLYRQRRLGEHGREFMILKLRTMALDAESDGVAQWSKGEDSRVTTVGRILRRSHLDELPQLWNVLRGEMTLVGPRPERPEIVSGLERQFTHYRRRHLVKPGIAGWAQARCGYAGSELGTAWKLCHDLYYIKHRSLLGDMVITFETMFVVFRDAHRALRVPSDRFILGEQPHG